MGDETAAKGMESAVVGVEDVLSRFDRLVASLPPTDSGAPQSDIQNLNPDFHITSLPPQSANPTHSLTLNAYSIFRPQYLLLTTSPSHNQSTPLDVSDLTAAWTALRILGSSHWAIYNCGPESGCSRVHKHMQIFPPPTDGFRFFPDVTDKAAAEDAPFRYFLRYIQPTVSDIGSDSEAADFLLAAYHDLLAGARSALQIPPSETWTTDPAPHNVILSHRWIMVVPRTRAVVGGLSANAAGMVGMVWVKSARDAELWEERGPADMLADVGIRA
ncbi:hypothetical protein GP486_005986 [Trichoglossum hirsutum]|uniref:Uncharacterized protein n=1 Tax=Trichoglossum hirsutum TaxID=265104 RepID=A0A9P8RLL4_9PEZI|nr:hypothetical protein GP486_005986 [Trichoglossum hirsutum]